MEDKEGLNDHSLERALTASLTLMFLLAVADLWLYQWRGTAALTVIAHALSLLLYLRHRLTLDVVKLIELVALVTDGYLLLTRGFALACPLATLVVIIYIGLNRERHLRRMKHDLEKVFASRNK